MERMETSGRGVAWRGEAADALRQTTTNSPAVLEAAAVAWRGVAVFQPLVRRMEGVAAVAASYPGPGLPAV